MTTTSVRERAVVRRLVSDRSWGGSSATARPPSGTTNSPRPPDGCSRSVPGAGFPFRTTRRVFEELVLLEPNPAFRTRLRELLDRTHVPATIVDGDVHDLPFPDSSFDTVTASLVFCSVRLPARALAEVHRVLRPGGRFLFHEHVRGGPVRGVVQDLLTPLHRRLADGCHADRDFEALLASSPLMSSRSRTCGCPPGSRRWCRWWWVPRGAARSAMPRASVVTGSARQWADAHHEADHPGEPVT